MNNRAATLDMTDPGNTHVAGPAQRGGGMKFSYASGSKPLDGYTIKRGVGIGGFGEVYFAVTDAGKEVALKRVQRNLEIELRGVSQCLNLKHGNLVDLYDIRYDDQGGAWVVMEFITGESLKDVIDRNPSGMPLEDVAHWFNGIAAGVGYLHDQGIVHRDLKPGNIFIDQGVIKIGDYGLAKFIAHSGRSGQTESVGTFHYMAPEIGKGSYGKEIDIYALGIILYEMLAGRVPFDGESSQEIVMRHLTEDADVSELPQPYCHVVAKALAKDPELRFSNIKQMLSDLAGQASGLPVVDATMVKSDVLYINDDPPPREMEFGPVKQGRGAGRLQAYRAGVSPAKDRRAGFQPAKTNPAGRMPTPLVQGAKRVSNWWQNSTFNTGVKVAIVVALVAAAMINVELFLPVASGLGVLFAIYLGVWFLATSMAVTPEQSSGIRFRSWQEMAREQLKAKQVGTRLGELSGSYLVATVIAALVSLVMIAAADRFDTNIDSLTLFTWLTMSGTLGAWAVLAVGKFCEGVQSDAIRRRVVMLALGLAVGAAAFGLHNTLLLNLQAGQAEFDMVNSNTTMISASGEPRLPLFLVFFGGLFVLPGWWKQADPLRKSRVNLISLAGCVLWGGILSLFWPFPQPWGFMLAATISLATQLSSPWMTSKDRELARREFRRA